MCWRWSPRFNSGIIGHISRTKSAERPKADSNDVVGLYLYRRKQRQLPMIKTSLYTLLAWNVLIILIFFSISESAQDKTLGEIRRELLGKEVVIGGTKATGMAVYPRQEALLDWHIAEGDTHSGYKVKKAGNFQDHAPYELKGRKGIVISIELVEDIFRKTKRGTSTDIFGEKIRDDTVENPYFDLVVRLEDSTLLITRNYYTNMKGSILKTIKDFDQQKNQIVQNIQTLVGKTIYPVGYSTIYPQDIGIKEITDTLRKDIYKLNGIENLTPLRIVNAKYLDNEHAILLKVESPQGRIGVILSPLAHISDESFRELPFLQMVAHSFLTSIPKTLSATEIEAIKKGSIFRGMSLTALHYSWGYPKKENDWGSTGKQLIYTDRLFVYIRDKKVVDWQALSR
jgi:hypothetical protein